MLSAPSRDGCCLRLVRQTGAVEVLDVNWLQLLHLPVDTVH